MEARGGGRTRVPVVVERRERVGQQVDAVSVAAAPLSLMTLLFLLEGGDGDVFV